MKEYILTVIVAAVMITLVAVAAGGIVYLEFKHGKNSLTFQLSRIGIIWATLILMLIIGGTYAIAATGWTVGAAKGAFEIVLAWTRENRLMASIIMWTATILVMILLYRMRVLTLSATIIIWLLHVWATYATWEHPAWPLIKAVFFAIFIGVRASDSGFQKLPMREPVNNDQASQPETRKTTSETTDGAYCRVCRDVGKNF